LFPWRCCGAQDRKSKNKSEKFFIFSADFVNYIGQTAEQLSKSFTGADAEVLPPTRR
jgi:hypothetical protein